jgi:hypothetical protein
MRIKCHQEEENLDLVFKNSRLSPNLDFPQFLTTRLGNTCSSFLLPKSPGHEDQPYDRSDQSPPAGTQVQPCPMQNSCCVSRALLQGLMTLRPCWNHVRTTTQNDTRLQGIQLRPPDDVVLHKGSKFTLDLMPHDKQGIGFSLQFPTGV